MWRLVALLVTLLVAHPLAIQPTKPIALVGGIALAVCAFGVAARFTQIFTAGVAIAVAEYALALVLSDSPPRLVGAVVTGVGAALALDLADFDRRFRDVSIARGVLARQLWHWAGFATLGVGLAGALVGTAGIVNVLVRLPWGPVLAAGGAAAALGAAALALWRVGRTPPEAA